MKRLILIALAMLPVHVPGQTSSPEPAALTAARATFLRQIMADSQLLTGQYERALAKAEVEAASGGSYEEARAIHQRRGQLEALFRGTASSLASPLPLAQARLTGSAQASGETLSGWRSGGSGAEWQNFRLPTGRYHLEFEVNMSDAPVAGSIYASSKLQPQQTAVFEFSESTLLQQEEGRQIIHISRSSDETTFATVRSGPLVFTRNPVTLRFATTAGYPANLIRIRNLRLVPLTEEEAVTPPSVTTTTQTLQQATSTFKAALETARKAATENYVSELRQLASLKSTLKPQTEAEMRRVEKMSSKLGRVVGVRSLTAINGSLDGFEEINDVRLASSTPTAGDRLRVQSAAGELELRLLWIDCAPSTGDAAETARFAKHFNIDAEDVPAIARAAREFTTGYLADKTFRLLVRPDRDKDGARAALIFLPNIGLYQHILVERGLAAVTAPPRNERRNALEKALIEALLATEDAAKHRHPPAGAWALSSALGERDNRGKP